MILFSKKKSIIVGFAINVNSTIPKDDELFKTATSLCVIFGDKIDENLLFESLIEGIDLFYNKWIDGGYNYIYKLWKKNQFYMNKNVVVHHRDGSLVEGLFANVLPDGDLVLKKWEEQEIISFYVVENFEILKNKGS